MQSPQMYLDVTGHKDVFSMGRIREVPCFEAYRKDPDSSLDPSKVVKYVVLLYSRDSILNRRPMPPLTERREIAAGMSDLDPSNQDVIDNLFDLYSEKIRDLIIDYLIHQNVILWTERCILEAQIQENQRIRLKPVQNKSINKPKRKKKGEEEEEDEPSLEDDDKYLIEASNKKFALTPHFDKYYELIKKYDLEIFQDHDNVKASATTRARRTMESMAR